MMFHHHIYRVINNNYTYISQNLGKVATNDIVINLLTLLQWLSEWNVGIVSKIKCYFLFNLKLYGILYII